MARRPHPARPRRGELPGEYLRSSLVSVCSGVLSEGGRIKEYHYIVKTTRLDNQFRVEVEHQGVLTVLPGRVIDQILRHRESIIKAQRRDRAVERAQALVKGSDQQ